MRIESMPRAGFTRLVAGAAVATLAAMACGGSGTGTGTTSKPPIKIGMAVGLTGYLADLDKALRDGAQLAVDDVNSKGGVSGAKLELHIEDMKSLPQDGVTSVTKLIVQDQVSVLINGFSSAGTAAEAPVAAQHSVPMMVASILPQDARWVFTTIPPAAFEVDTRLDYAKTKGLLKVGVLRDPSPYSGTQTDVVQKDAPARGMTIVDVEQAATDATDLTPQLRKIADKKPDVVLKFGAGPSNILAAKDMAAAGLSVPLLLSIDDMSIFQQATKAYPNTMFVAAPPQVSSAISDPGLKQALNTFVTPWKKKYGDRDPAYGGRGWDAVQILVQAIKKAGSSDGAKIRDVLETLKYQGTSAVYEYSASSHYGIKSNPLKLGQIQGSAVNVVYDPAKIL